MQLKLSNQIRKSVCQNVTKLKMFLKKKKSKISERNSKFKTSTASRNKPKHKQKTPPKNLHQKEIHNVINDAKILVKRKVVPPNTATEKIPLSDKDRKEEKDFETYNMVEELRNSTLTPQ